MKNFKQTFGDLGQHWTPRNTAEFMTTLIENSGKILEPSSGSGIFLDILPNATGVEVDPTVIQPHHKTRTITSSFFDFNPYEKFETIIGNPPYVNGKLLTREWFGDTWCGKLPRTANAYFHFIEKSVTHLDNDGELIFIVPVGFMSSSKGKWLRTHMFETGSFTHMFFNHDAHWDSASVSTMIFRWVKNKSQKFTITDENTLKTLVCRNGYFWLCENEHADFLGDFFTVTVGAAPSRAAIEQASSTDKIYQKSGVGIPVSQSPLFKPWPRERLVSGKKLLIQSTPSRSKNLVWYSESDAFLDFAMIPKMEMDLQPLVPIFNKWFLENGERLGLIIEGRWIIGVTHLENTPITADLANTIKSMVKSKQ